MGALLFFFFFFFCLFFLPGVGHPLDYQNGCLIIFLFFLFLFILFTRRGPSPGLSKWVPYYFSSSVYSFYQAWAIPWTIKMGALLFFFFSFSVYSFYQAWAIPWTIKMGALLFSVFYLVFYTSLCEFRIRKKSCNKSKNLVAFTVNSPRRYILCCTDQPLNTIEH